MKSHVLAKCTMQRFIIFLRLFRFVKTCDKAATLALYFHQAPLAPYQSYYSKFKSKCSALSSLSFRPSHHPLSLAGAKPYHGKHDILPLSQQCSLQIRAQDLQSHDLFNLPVTGHIGT